MRIKKGPGLLGIIEEEVMSKKVRVSITYSWEITKNQWIENKDFHESLPENIRWKANDDPKSMFYFLNEIDNEPDVRVEVEGIG